MGRQAVAGLEPAGSEIRGERVGDGGVTRPRMAGAEALAEAVPDPARRALILVLGLSVFFESATGFGIGIVVAAPLFVALGYRPRDAALLALAGQRSTGPGFARPRRSEFCC